MTEPKRLRDSAGPAGKLMAGAKALRTPSAARRRALAFTGTAAGLAATKGAAAASATTLLKTFAICVCVGAAGGGAMSLAATEIAQRYQPSPSVEPSAAERPRVTVVAPSAPVVPPNEVASAAPEPDALSLIEPDQRQAPSPPPTPAPASDEPRTPRAAEVGSSLFEEQRFIESARAAVARGDGRAALNALEAYDRAFARKQFGPEALALRVEALRSGGQLAAAQRLAVDFARLYPNHPLLSRVRAVR